MDSTQPQQPDAANNEKLVIAPPSQAAKQPFYKRFQDWYVDHKRSSIPLSALALLVIIFLVPWSRYHTAGLVVKKNFNLKVTDATAGIPVSGAEVSVDSIKRTTDGSGMVSLPRLSAGYHHVQISKTYYTSRHVDILVPILAQKQTPNLTFKATGRQVKITVTNLINQQSVSGAEITIDNSKSVTDKNGTALVVVPAGAKTKEANISSKSYNDAKATIIISENEVRDNPIKLTPAGQVYFLSKLSGKIDVVKANLDGTGRQTILAGTGKEADTGTVLLASRDWQYLALLSNRDGKPKLYIIKTDDDSLITMDQIDADFTMVGWQDHYFVYTVGRHNWNNWQPGAFSIKSYNADTGKVLSLANTNATGTGNADAEYENIWEIQLVGSDVVYARTWYKYPGYLQVDGKQNVLAGIHPDGTNSRQLKSVDSSTSYISNLKLQKPRQLAFTVQSTSDSSTTYFTMDKNGNVSQTPEIKDIYEDPVTYLQSPSGDQTFWREPRDGKYTLFIGDQDAAAPQQIATLSDFKTYGWYTDKYLLVSKNNSELYVIAKAALKSDKEAIKITDYHKPAQDFYGYGGGYGGL
jgi:hypothetical protein